MIIKRILSIVILIGSIYILDRPLGTIPPLGKFLDPFHGYSALIGSDELPTDLIFPQLSNPVEVVWDDLRIPHIFAQNDMDLFFIQGYIMAFDRLWQMEFQTHAAAGRMSEIVGEKALGYDRFQRRIGMVYGAKNTLEEAKKDTLNYPLLESYTAGVNAFISTLDADKYPLEYKILDYSPEPWTPLKTILLLKKMAWMLTGRNTELAYTRLMNDMGIEVVDELFPVFPKDYDPIIPRGTQFNFDPINLQVPKQMYQSKADTPIPTFKHTYGIGSNNWAIHGSRTKSGKPILANDPHLGLSLPSIWYLMHLNSPTLNVMGVTIPGAPGIILGFNDKIAWGATNGQDDVIDWYDIQFRDDSQMEYLYDGQWVATYKEFEEINIRGGDTFLDIVTYTHHGPIVWDYLDQTPAIGKNANRNNIRQTSPGRAMHWLAHDASNEVSSLLSVNRAQNYNEFVEAYRLYTCPGQNFCYADVEGNIAIWHTGNQPAKWKGQGRFISNGADPKYDWQATIPHEQKPHILNPKRGYVSSANQHPTDENYPYFLSEFFWLSYRGNQVNRQLDTLYHATTDDMKSIHGDNLYLFARNTLSILLNQLDSLELTTEQADWKTRLQNWDYYYSPASVEATFFDNWKDNLESLTWTDDLGPDDSLYLWPYHNKLDELIRYSPKSRWFDDRKTTEIETLADIAQQSFLQTADELHRQLGEVDTQWEWQHYRGTDINHVANIPGMGRLNLKTGGGPDIVNATGKTYGPSWRLILEMDAHLDPMGIYPGGQSGFPGSEYYDNFVDDWVNGHYYDLPFSNNINDIIGHRIKCKTR